MEGPILPSSILEISQINARSYSSGGVSSTSNIFQDVGHVSNSVNIEVNAGVYNEVHQTLPHTRGLKALFKSIADSAIHNSSERGDAPKCYEGTRLPVLNEISNWITSSGDSGDASKKILWVNGPAGWGKTAVMGSLADKWHKEGRLAASFFFSSSSASAYARSKQRFVTTLVYQIQQHRGLDQHISQAIAAAVVKDPAILGKHLREQMEVLLLKPLRDCRKTCDMTTVPRIIVVDGLDQCGAGEEEDPSRTAGSSRAAHRDQEEILACVLQASTDATFPFKFIISSRPDRSVRNFLSHESTADVISHLSLGRGRWGSPKKGLARADGGWDPDKDIDRFLRSKFREIRREYPHLRSPGHWPGERDIGKLVQKASGQFIYAESVIQFIKTPSNPPQTQLEYVLGKRGRNNPEVNPFEHLDAVFVRVLNSTPKPELTLQRLLAYRWFQRETLDLTHSMTESVSAWFFARLCETAAGEADIVFGDLAALVQVPDHSDMDSKYVFYHESFLDFLDDPNRSRALHTSGGLPTEVHNTHKWIISRFLRCLNCKGPEVPIADPTHLPKFIPHFFRLWGRIIAEKDTSSLIIEQPLSQCDAVWWINHDSVLYNPTPSKGFWRVMCVLVHRKCRIYAPCAPVCRHWRDAVVRAGKDDNHRDLRETPASNNDRFFLKLKRRSNFPKLSTLPFSPKNPGHS